MRSLCFFASLIVLCCTFAACQNTPDQQQANLDTKVLASQIAEAIKTDPMLPLDAKTKDQAQRIADAVVTAIDAKGNITPESAVKAVAQSGVVPPEYLGYGALGLLALRIIQAQMNAKKSSS